jgi:type IV secretory pathway TrbD component
MKPQDRINKSGGMHDLPISMAILLGLIAVAVIFWIHPVITAGMFAILIALMQAASRRVHVHATPPYPRHVFSQRIKKH